MVKVIQTCQGGFGAPLICDIRGQTCPNQVLSNESSPESRPDVYPESWVKSWQEIQDQSQDMKNKNFFRGLDISLEFLVKTWVKTWDMSRDSILIFRISKVYNRQYRLRIKAVFKWRVDGLVSKLGIPGPVRNIRIYGRFRNIWESMDR